jgi:hypothetical protein
MYGRPTRLRRLGFGLGLLVSAALFAYSLAGIVSAGGDQVRSALSAGKSTSATSPPSSRDASRSRPPCAVATARTIDNPTPVPRRDRRRSNL